jgi:hypothetical protein
MKADDRWLITVNRQQLTVNDHKESLYNLGAHQLNLSQKLSISKVSIGRCPCSLCYVKKVTPVI